VDVFQGGIVQELVSEYESTEESPLVSPMVISDIQVSFCSVNVDERPKHDWDFDTSSGQDLGSKFCESCSLRISKTRASLRDMYEVWRLYYGVLNRLSGTVHDVSD